MSDFEKNNGMGEVNDEIFNDSGLGPVNARFNGKTWVFPKHED